MNLLVTVETPGGVETLRLRAGKWHRLTLADGSTVTGIFEGARWSHSDGDVSVFLLSDAGSIGYPERSIVDASELVASLYGSRPADTGRHLVETAAIFHQEDPETHERDARGHAIDMLLQYRSDQSNINAASLVDAVIAAAVEATR